MEKIIFSFFLQKHFTFLYKCYIITSRKEEIDVDNKELIKAIREIYRLWNMNDTEEDIDFILNEVIRKIGE